MLRRYRRHFRGPPLPSDSRDVVISVVVPAYNEEATAEAAIGRIRSVPFATEIVAVNDGSTDGTGTILDRLAAAGAIDRVLHLPRNRGKGAAVRAAISVVQGHVTVIQDADLEYDPQEFSVLLEPMLRDRADAVFGSRFQAGPHRVLYFWHSVGNRVVTLVSNMCTDLNLTDVETCYKMVRTDLLKSLVLTSDRFGFEVELTAQLSAAGARVWEVPISYDGRTYDEGKKIGWRDGVAALWHIVRFNFLSSKARSR